MSMDGFALEMRSLDRSSLPSLWSLQSIIAQNLTHPQVFLLHDREFFLEMLCLPHLAIGIFDHDQLIAYSILRLPESSGAIPDHPGWDIGLPQEDLAKVAHLQTVAVHPAYRGRGLQRWLVRAQIRSAECLGYRHICSTVSPENPVSLANMLSSGLMIVALLPKFQGWWRFILHRDMAMLHPLREIGLEGEAALRAIFISDLEGQANLLREGFKGFKMEMRPEGIFLIYGRERLPENDGNSADG